MLKCIVFVLVLAVAACHVSIDASYASAVEFVLTDSEKEYLASIRGKPLRLAYSYDLLHFCSPGGASSGMLSPVLDFMRGRLELKVEAIKTDRAAAFSGIENGEADMYGLVAPDGEKRKKFHSTKPLYHTYAAIVSRAASPLGSLLNLSNKKIGLLCGSDVSKILMAYLAPYGSVVYYPDISDMLAGLERGDIDCLATTDNAEVEILRHADLRYEFAIGNFHANQALVSGRKDMRPLFDIIDRYLASPEGELLRAAIQAARREELLRTQRERLADKINFVRERYEVVKMFDSGVLYPLSFMQDGAHKGLQSEILGIFTWLTGLEVRVEDLEQKGEGLQEAVERIKNGSLHMTSGAYYDVDLESPDLDFSVPVWTDKLRLYAYGGQTKGALRDLRIGTIPHGLGYLDWDALSGKQPEVYSSRHSLMRALMSHDIDVAFMGEMAFNYLYTVLNDYQIREFGSTDALVRLRMIYGKQNAELNFLMNEAIVLYQVFYPHGRARWQYQAEKYRSDYIRVRDERGVLIYCGAIVLGIMLLLLIYSLRRYVRYDRQVSRLLKKQQSIDFTWGNLKNEIFVSKGDYPFLRKWGFKFEGLYLSLDELSKILGRDLRADYAAEMKIMRENHLDFHVTDNEVQIPGEESRYYRRYLHLLNEDEFMACLLDVTDEMRKVKNLTRAAETDFLSSLLNRRAINALLLQKCAELRKTGGRSFVMLIDIDDFKKINDSYGHDVGDDVLKNVSRVIQNAPVCRKETARWGGEEFLILFDGESMESARETALHIVKSIADSELKIKNTEKIVKVTVSAGLAELNFKEGYTDSVRRADMALYEAKNSGKNCVRVKD